MGNTSPRAVSSPTHLAAVGILDADKLAKCTHCGFCLPTCPTYRELGLEMDSPRGRLYLMKSVIEGRLDPDEDFQRYIYRCLDCRACETACPSGVPFGILVEQARAMFEKSYRRPLVQRWLIRAVFDGLLPHPGRLRWLFRVLRLYQRSGAQWLVRRSGLLRAMGRLQEMESFLPPIPSPALQRQVRARTPSVGERRFRVGFLTGCLMHPLFADINGATVRVLARNGCEVVVPPGQTCCGALHVHNGVRDTAIALARRNIEAFVREDVDAIITNSAGCGAALKEYPELLDRDACQADARRFAAKMRDVSEWLVEVGLQQPRHAIPKRVTYDEPCHLVHGQKVAHQPRAILRAIPGLELVELRESDWCCGSAGVYNILQPELSRQMLERKMKHVRDTEAEILATGNPGCLLQLRAGVRRAGLSMHVMHPVELLDWAYRGVEPDSVRRGF
jgi:glycolate oxidase iron-sulfur subunit